MIVNSISNNQGIIITNIQHFSLHDGPGIRTTVFLKGCSIRCPWCCNPENLEPYPQQYIKNGVEGKYGLYYSARELSKELLNDSMFYLGEIRKPENYNISHSGQLDLLPGGITFSGGEALLQMEGLVPVCEILGAENIHIAMETSLFALEEQVWLAIKNIHLFYVDIKILDKQRCKSILGGDLDLFLNNLDILCQSGKPLVFRIPIIGTYTDDSENISKVIDLISKTEKKANVIRIELIKEHNLGISKYKSLRESGVNIDIPNSHVIYDDFIERYKASIETVSNTPVVICKL